MKIKENKNAISLIVLVITVLILSILAATVIISLSNTSIIEETSKTVFKSDMTSYKEAYELYVTNETLKDYNYDRSNDNYKYPDDADKLNEIFGNVSDKYKEGLKIQGGKLVYETEDETEKEIAKDLGMEAVKLIGTEKDENGNSIYRGYYVDVDGDNKVDGVIFADLKVGGTVSFGNNVVTITPENKTYKEYTTNGTYNGKFGENPVLKAVGSGEDRFYVMALEDINTGTYYCWYDTEYDGGISDYSTVTSTAFGTGKTNTATMIAKWNGSEGTEEGYGDYGKQNDNGAYLDMWGVIQEKVYGENYTKENKTEDDIIWFVPSKVEWIAFVSYLKENGLTTGSSGNYTSKFGLNGYYWSSSLYWAFSAWRMRFYDGDMSYCLINDSSCVRLAATF